MITLKPAQLKALQRAIEEAASWRGSMTGDPDPKPLQEFDRFIANAESALKIVKQMNNEVKAINRS